MAMTVGQSHLLDDVISLVHIIGGRPILYSFAQQRTFAQLELDPEDGPSVFERMTLTYGVGDQHGLFTPMKDAQLNISEL